MDVLPPSSTYFATFYHNAHLLLATATKKDPPHVGCRMWRRFVFSVLAAATLAKGHLGKMSTEGNKRTIHITVEELQDLVSTVKGMTPEMSNELINKMQLHTARHQASRYLFTFGKYKGLTLQEVYSKDLGYLVWMNKKLAEDPATFIDTREAIKAFID